MRFLLTAVILFTGTVFYTAGPKGFAKSLFGQSTGEGVWVIDRCQTLFSIGAIDVRRMEITRARPKGF